MEDYLTHDTFLKLKIGLKKVIKRIKNEKKRVTAGC